MKTLWKVLGLIAVVVLFGCSKNSNDSLDNALLKAASEMNKKLPMMIDSETRLDTTTGGNKTFQYNYTLVNYSAANISSQEIHNALEQKIINGVCTTKEMEAFVKKGVTVAYAYYGNDGKQITVISVAPSQCNKT